MQAIDPAACKRRSDVLCDRLELHRPALIDPEQPDLDDHARKASAAIADWARDGSDARVIDSSVSGTTRPTCMTGEFIASCCTYRMMSGDIFQATKLITAVPPPEGERSWPRMWIRR
jgi:hypothetical protein